MMTSVQGRKGPSPDRMTTRLSQMGTMVGNGEAQLRLGQSNTLRDEILDYIRGRLGVVREVQTREEALTTPRYLREWGDDIADQQKRRRDGLGLGDPMRWRETAGLYDLSLQALCQGNLHRAQELLRQAIREEQAQFRNLPGTVDLSDLTSQVDEPAGVATIAEGQSCSSCPRPGDIVELSRLIQNDTSQSKDVSVAQRAPDPWWTDEQGQDDDPDKPKDGDNKPAEGEKKKRSRKS